MAFPIDSPLPIFFDRNADVLDAGFVYIGEVNQNPETQPIAVFWDAAQTTPAPQPLRTVRGYIARNGDPANLYVNSDYSIVVRDRNRQLILSEPTASASLIFDYSVDRSVATISLLRNLPIPNISGSRTVAVTVLGHTAGTGRGGGQFRWDPVSVVADDNGLTINPTGNLGAGRWIRIVEGEYNLDMFGADNTGVLSSSAIIQTALNSVSARGGGTLRATGVFLHDTGTVTIPSRVVFIGEDGIPCKVDLGGTPISQLNITTGEGSTTTPAFLMQPNCGFGGFTAFWPNQLRSNVVPIQYGWFATTAKVSSSGDNIWIGHFMLVNPYNGIDLDFGGQFSIGQIYGQAMYTLVRIDRVFDFSKLEMIHYWEFWANPGDGLYEHCWDNGVALEVGRTDGLLVDQVRAWRCRAVIHFVDNGFGGCWGQFNQVQSDSTRNHILVDQVNQVQIGSYMAFGGTQLTTRDAVTIGSAVNGTMQFGEIRAYQMPNGVRINRGSSVDLSIGSILPRRAGTDERVAQYSIINESNFSTVRLGQQAAYRDISGRVSIGNMSPIFLTNDVSPATFSTPDVWQVNARVTAVAGGSRFDLQGAISTQTLAIPSNLSQEVGLFVLEADVQSINPDNILGAVFYMRLSDNTADDLLFPSDRVSPIFRDRTLLRIPFIVRDSTYQFQFVFGGAGGPCSMDVIDMRVWRVSADVIDPTLVDWVSTNQPNTLGRPQNIAYQAGAKITRQLAAPTAGLHLLGDRVVRATPVVGQPKAWTATVAGSPGTWVSEGNL